MLHRLVAIALTAVLTVGGTAVAYAPPIEDYADYQPQTACVKKPRTGTVQVAAWLEEEWSGTVALASLRACKVGGASEHKDGRAIDWMLDWHKKKQRAKASAFLDRLFATDDEGNPAALARRMGVMYVIWNDRMYASYRQFEERDYLSGGCPSKKKCSNTLRHRDHVHISLSKRGGKGLTSWFQMSS